MVEKGGLGAIFKLDSNPKIDEKQAALSQLEWRVEKETMVCFWNTDADRADGSEP